MNGYLGENKVDINKSEFKSYTQQDWAMMYIELYSGIDGAHHKDWLLDQVSRILKGTKMIVKKAHWEGGYSEYRFTLGKPTVKYTKWVVEMKSGEDGAETYDYSTGIAP